MSYINNNSYVAPGSLDYSGFQSNYGPNPASVKTTGQIPGIIQPLPQAITPDLPSWNPVGLNQPDFFTVRHPNVG